MDVSTKMILVGIASGVVGGGVVGLLTAIGVSQAFAMAVGIGLVTAAVQYVHRTGERRKS
jgi:hypothetical protein